MNNKIKRENIPTKLKRELMREVGWRCAVPSCRVATALEFAHIVSHCDDGEVSFSNLIVLCANCHSRFDSKTEKYMTQAEMLQLKNNLLLLNNRYSSFEIRVIEHFTQELTDQSIRLLDRDLDVMYLVKDGIIKDKGIRYMNAIGIPPKDYILTDKGKSLVELWRRMKSIDDTINLE